jgi:hypothetical protein
VVAGGVGDHGGQQPALIGQQWVPGTEVGLPGHFHGVGDIETFPWCVRAQQEQLCAGRAVRVAES